MDSIKFTPVRGTEANILSMPKSDGQIYFTTDTKRIYMDTATVNKLPMGGAGNSGIYYGKKTLTEDETTSTILTFSLEDEEIEGTELPNVDDLVLNAPDGCFYRVTALVDTQSFTAKRLTVAGSGGGSTDAGVNLTLTVLSGIATGQTYVLGQSSNITFKGDVDNGDSKIIYAIEITNTYAGTTTTKSYGPFSDDLGNVYTFDLGSNLSLGTNSVKISASSDNAGKTATKNFTLLNCVEMRLEAVDDFNPLKCFKGKFNFYCKAVGEGLTKSIAIYVDDILIPAITKTNISLREETETFEIPTQSHGMHTIKAVMTCTQSAATDSIEYNICCIEDGNDAPVIWYNNTVPTSITNHDVLNIEYMVYNPVKSTAIETHYYINNSEIATSPLEIDYSPTTWLRWRVIGYSVGDNVFTLRSGTTSKSISILVNPDTKRNLDVVTTGLHVNLSAAGRSNNENAQSRSTWSCTSLYDNTTVTSVGFNDFNWYNNGWITDDDGETCLRISNGASIEIPLKVMNSKALSDSLAFEFVFKVRNVQNYSTLINTVVDNPDSENPTIRKEVSSTDGVWGNYYNNNIGFCLGTQEAFFKSSDTLVSGRYKEDELTHVTFVVEATTANSNANKLIYIYVNGINSGITKYNVTTDSLASGCQTLKINSDYCDIDLYNIRVYKTNLTAQYVVQNYLADYNDAELYDMNEEIVDYSNGIPSINYTKMLEYNSSHLDALLMPYMVIETTDVNDTLPYKKIEIGDAWKVNIKFVNPTLDYEYENNLWTAKDLADRGFSSNEEMYLHSCPSYEATGAELNVQGTSSQGYPVRNYKAKFKSASKWIYTGGPLEGISILNGGKTASGMKVPKKWFMDSWVGENKTTLKADYMDSSGVHNTGFASFVSTLYSKHPLDDYANLPDDCDTSILRTSVYGFPIMMFHKTHDGVYKFLGRYNYNLDKGCDDSYGFCGWGDDHYVDVTSKVTADNFDNTKLFITALNDDNETEYVELAEDAVYDSSATYYRLDEEADSNALNADYDATDPYSRQYLPWSEAAECWEFSNNQGGRCSLKKADFEETDSTGKLTVTDDFEYRYHVDADSFDNAYAGVGQAVKSDATVFNSQEELNNFIIKKMSRWESFVDWIVSTDSAQATDEDLETPVTYGSSTYTTDSAEYRLAKFANEFNNHLDKEYCLVYFIMTELLICYDSRGKNLMMATWGPKVRGGSDIWYPIFYDIDTQLGVNNSGVPYWDYYEEASKNGTFSTPDSVLWVNLWKCFESEIKNKYDELTGVKLTIDNLDGYYRFDPEVSKSKAMCGYRPIIINNVDEYQKYIAPSISGYVDTAGTSGIITDTFYYCLQGTRELQRALLLRNRFNYIGSQWQAGNYSMTAAKQGIQTRFDANDYPNTSDKFLGRTPSTEEAANGYVYAEPGTEPLDFTCDYSITPYLKQYISYWYDDTKSGTTYASDGETVTVPMLSNKKTELENEPHKTQQLIYWGGAEYISSLGDLSKKYLDMLWIQSAKRLKDLIIGSDLPGYSNTMINSTSFKPDDAATAVVDGVTKSNPNAKSLLEKIVLTNLSGLSGTLDFSGSEKLKELRALNTNVSSFILADGVQIEKLHLPSTITNLILKEPTSLTGVLSSPDPTSEEISEYVSTNVTAATYDPSIHYINTLDGYKLCNDASYFGYYYTEVSMTAETFADRTETLYTYDRNNDEYLEVSATADYSAGLTYYTQHAGTEYNETRSYYKKEVSTQDVYPNGLYIEGLTNLSTITDSSKTFLSTINIVGGNMGYDSFDLLNKTVQIKQKMQANQSLDSKYDKHLSVNLENVDWTPYRLVEPGETPVSGSTYKLLNDHDILVTYSKVSNEYPNWDLNVTNELVYEYDETEFNAHSNEITDLSMLDTFINDYAVAKGVYDALDSKDNFDSDSYNYFKSTDSYAQGPTLASLTGTVFINNADGDAIEESRIKNYYHDTYYPKLTIQVANVTTANVTKFVEVTNETTGQEYVWDILKYPVSGTGSRTYPELTEVVGSKLNYDFRGWSLTHYTQDELNAMTEDEITNILVTNDSLSGILYEDQDDRVIKLYAVYTIHSYSIVFKNYDDTILEEKTVPWGTYIAVPTAIPHRDESDLDLLEGYKFLGYSRIKNGTATDLVSMKKNSTTELNISASQDLTLYATYELLDDVHENVMDSTYLEISASGLLSVKSGIQLSGKITLPKTLNNITVRGIAYQGFYDQTNITHIFLESPETHSLSIISDSAFACDGSHPNGEKSKLVYLETPVGGSITVGAEAFIYCDSFLNGIEETYAIDFFDSLVSIGEKGFSQIKSGFTAGIYFMPGLTKVDNGAFYSANAATKLQFGTSASRLDISSVEWGTGITGYALASYCHISNVDIYSNNDLSEWNTLLESNFSIRTVYTLSYNGSSVS